ncbi:tripartite tricarboxylate transporter TctB family protein [Deferribacter thermophilus]|uniref:tripartite tricarboxylate transporter TctB family protein n=1 Tax=Deferribacter thermophilus TaxID=53573 RepID=UPI003C221A7F
MSDRIFGLVGLGLAIFYLWAASIIQESFITDAVGPKTFPYIIGAVLLLCSLYILIKPDPEPDWPDFKIFIEIVFATAVLFLYAWCLPKLGFIISTFFATTYLSWRLGTKLLGSIITGFLTSIGIYVAFHLILGLSLAKGPFGF